MKFALCAAPALVLLLAAVSVGASALENVKGLPASVTRDGATGQVRLTSGRLELVVDTRNGLNPNVLRDRVTGASYADSDYVWPGGGMPEMTGAPRIDASRPMVEL